MCEDLTSRSKTSTKQKSEASGGKGYVTIIELVKNYVDWVVSRSWSITAAMAAISAPFPSSFAFCCSACKDSILDQMTSRHSSDFSPVSNCLSLLTFLRIPWDSLWKVLLHTSTIARSWSRWTFCCDMSWSFVATAKFWDCSAIAE
jgi:hypothetical protein